MIAISLRLVQSPSSWRIDATSRASAVYERRVVERAGHTERRVRRQFAICSDTSAAVHPSHPGDRFGTCSRTVPFAKRSSAAVHFNANIYRCTVRYSFNDH
jgi:hypothetical protein